MQLFVVKENEVEVNSPWIRLIPAFNVLFDSRASYNRQAKPKKVMAYIYFILDYGSPLRNWVDDEKEEQALLYSGLEKEDVSVAAVKEAMRVYEELQIKACRPLKTYRSSLSGLDKMDEYFKNINFDLVDKQGKLLYSPNQFISNLALMNKAYNELEKLSARIEQEMANNSGIRGKSNISERELRDQQDASNDTPFREGDNQTDAFSSRSMVEIGEIYKRVNGTEE